MAAYARDRLGLDASPASTAEIETLIARAEGLVAVLAALAATELAHGWNLGA